MPTLIPSTFSGIMRTNYYQERLVVLEGDLNTKRGNRDHKIAGYHRILCALCRKMKKGSSFYCAILRLKLQTPTLLEGFIAIEMTGSGT